MTIKCLTEVRKILIVAWYQRRLMTQKELSVHFGVSERTINRVLIEAGVATAVPRLQGEAYQAMQILKKHNISVNELDEVLTGQLYAKAEQQYQSYATQPQQSTQHHSV